MAKEKNTATTPDPASVARLATPEEDKTKARRWFARAKELADAKNWDFAIKCYLDGLGYWPEAVDEGHAPMRFAACERNVRGGKKLGFSGTVRFSTSGKDAKKAMLNSAWLLAHDPFNASYMEGLLRSANKLRAEEVLLWIGPIYSNAIESEKKLNPKRFALLSEIYEEAADRANARNETVLAAEFYERAARSLKMQSQADPRDLTLENRLRDLSTKLTILRGKYETAGTFQESMRDAGQQKDIHDRERFVQADESVERLIKQAQRELDEDPDNPNKIHNLVELWCRRENEADEKKAIALLVEKFKQTGTFRFKLFADDIYIKQLRRELRAARAAEDRERIRQTHAKLLNFEINSYRDRVKNYPTDNRVKYELAHRYLLAKKYDEAIPQFQIARADPKVRTQCDLSLGRCFFEKGFHAQAIGTLTKAIESYELQDDQLGKDLRYWLGRSLEADGKISPAREAYGRILELDYNFRDVRDRIGALPQE